jgi:hypothetical protein
MLLYSFSYNLINEPPYAIIYGRENNLVKSKGGNP